MMRKRHLVGLTPPLRVALVLACVALGAASLIAGCGGATHDSEVRDAASVATPEGVALPAPLPPLPTLSAGKRGGAESAQRDPVGIESLYMYNLPQGWSTIGVPLDNVTSLGALGENMFGFNATTQMYYKVTSPGGVDTRLGYWTHVTSAGTYDVIGQDLTTGPQQVPLLTGWNLVSFRSSGPVAFENVALHLATGTMPLPDAIAFEQVPPPGKHVFGTAFRFPKQGTSAYEMVDLVEGQAGQPGSGYWIFSWSDGYLSFGECQFANDLESVEAGGAVSDGNFSADGRYATYLNNGQVYWRDRCLGTTRLVSQGFVYTDPTQPANADSPCVWPSVSDDGRFVVFETQAKNLVQRNGLPVIKEPTDPVDPDPVVWRVYRREMRTTTGEDSDVIELVSFQAGTESAPEGANGDSKFPVVSPDGHDIAFASAATDIAGAAGTGWAAYLWHDGTKQPSAGGPTLHRLTEHNGVATLLALDMTVVPDGSGGDDIYVVYPSTLADGGVLGGDPDGLGADNGAIDVFLASAHRPNDGQPGWVPAWSSPREQVNPETTLGEGNGIAEHGISISADGNAVVYRSTDDLLLRTGTSPGQVVYLTDGVLGGTKRTRLVTADASGNYAPSADANPHVSSDGAYVVFSSDNGAIASRASATGSPGRHVYVWKATGSNGEVKSVPPPAQLPTNPDDARRPAISADGSWIVFDDSQPISPHPAGLYAAKNPFLTVIQPPPTP